MRRSRQDGESIMYRIFLVEDDFALADALQSQISMWGNEVRLAKDLRNILPEFTQYEPHLVLLDIGLPFFNGFHWCQEIRKISNVPVVFLSSAADNMNIVMAMNMGGDDFIPKPVDPMVLTAKISAILRRNYDMMGTNLVIEHKGVTLNVGDGSIEWQGEKIDLTKNEFRILKSLMENKGKIVSRDALMNDLWQNDCYVEENTLTVNVTRLRKKLESYGVSDFITTKPGSGYIIL